MRLLRLALLLCAAAVAWPTAATSREFEPGEPTPSARVGVFYYPWFATPWSDGHYSHWQQNGVLPPSDVASIGAPCARAVNSCDKGPMSGATCSETMR